MENYSALQSFIDSQIKYQQRKLDGMLSNLNNDFSYYLSWNAEESYKLHLGIKEMRDWEKALENESEEKFLESTIKSYKRFLDSQNNVVGYSTNQVSNLCTAWKYQAVMELKSQLESFNK
jgi:hypothetical protein